MLLCLAAGLLACTKNPEESTAGMAVKFEINVTETKTDDLAKTGWATGDKIQVFFMGIPNKYVLLTRQSDGSWTETMVGEPITNSEIGALDDNYSLTAVHFPFDVDVAYEDTGEWAKNKFTFTVDGKPVFGRYYLYDQQAYTVEYIEGVAVVKATLTMKIPSGMVQLYFPPVGGRTMTQYTFGSPMIRPVACMAVGLNGTLQEEALQAGARMDGVALAEGVVFAGRYDNPGGATMHTFTLANDNELMTFKKDRTESGPLVEGTLYTFPTLPSSWSIVPAADLYVDLGLSSGVKWAKCNVGAANPEEFGDYFAWAELQPKSSYLEDNYVYGKSNAYTKYCNDASKGKDGFTDSLTNLVPEDDAAYAALGGKFRTPTEQEWLELIGTRTQTDKYTWTWYDGVIVKYNGMNVVGFGIVRNSTSDSLFFPAAGYMDNNVLKEVGDLGTYGFYWSSSLYTSYPGEARYSNFSASIAMDLMLRHYGASVRPVYKD